MFERIHAFCRIRRNNNDAKCHLVPRSKAVFQSVLALTLTAGMLAPLASCRKPDPLADTGADKVTGNVHWTDFDDGCDALSLDVPYLNSHADELQFDLICDEGRFASTVPVEALSLGGALASWQVATADRIDETTVRVTLQRNPDAHNTGARLGYVRLAASSVRDVLTPSEAVSSDDIPQESRREYTPDEINSMKDVQWPDDATHVNADIGDDELETAEALMNGAYEGQVTELSADAQQQERNVGALPPSVAAQEETVPTAVSTQQSNDTFDTQSAQASNDTSDTEDVHEVAVIYAHPALTLDPERSQVEGNTFKAVLMASDLTLPSSLSAQDFSLENADGCSIEDVHTVNASEMELTIHLSSEGMQALSAAQVTLAGNAHELGTDVVCSLEIPDPWLALSPGYQQEETGEVVFEADLKNSTAEITPDDVVVQVDGQSTSDWELRGNADGTYDIALQSDAVPEDGIVTVDVAEVPDGAGQAVDVAPTAVVCSGGDARIPIIDDLIDSTGSYFLNKIVDIGWQSYYEYVIGLHDATMGDIMDELGHLQEQISDLSTQISMLSNDVLIGQNRITIDNANQLAARIKTEELQLSDKVQAILAQSDPTKRQQMTQEFAKQEKTLIDNLATDMGVLFYLITNADSSTGHDLVLVYDDLMSQSYNWGSQTYAQRQNFRSKLASIWANGYTMVTIAYGVTGNKNYLDELDKQSETIKKIINEARAIDPSCYISDDGLRHYCNTTGKWYASLRGSDTADKWDKGFQTVTNKMTKPTVHAASPFRTYTYRGFSGGADTVWDGCYLNTTEAKMLTSKLHDGQTLKAELEEAGFSTAKYLVTSDRFDRASKIVYLNNDWYMDTFEVAACTKAGDGFTHDKKHYDGSYRFAVVKYIKHINWYTDCGDLFALVQSDS